MSSANFWSSETRQSQTRSILKEQKEQKALKEDPKHFQVVADLQQRVSELEEELAKRDTENKKLKHDQRYHQAMISKKKKRNATAFYQRKINAQW